MRRALAALSLAPLILALGLGALRAEEGAISVCVEALPESLDPAFGIRDSVLPLGVRQIYDRLVEIGDDGVSIEPRLARWWDISADGLEYVLKLRSGLAFHAIDGFTPTRPFAADDVVFTFTRLIDDAHAVDPAGGGGVSPRAVDLAAIIAQVEAIDQDRVRFTLTRPHAGFLAMLASDGASILSAEHAASGELGARPVGTGPFRLDGVENGTIRLAAHADYWDRPPAAPGLEIRAVADPADRFRGLIDGSCDLALSPDPADLAALARDGIADVIELPREAVVAVAFNTAKAAVADARLRKALAAVLDRDAIAAAAGAGAAATTRLMSPGPGGAAPTQDGSQPAAARKYLAFRASLGTLPDLVLVTAALGDPAGSDPVAGAIAEAWRAAGVSVTVRQVPWSGFGPAVRKGAHDAALFAVDIDPGNEAITLASLLGCAARGATNLSNWCNAEFEARLAAATGELDPENRVAALGEARAVVAAEAPLVALFRPSLRVAVARGVSGVDAASLARGDFRAARAQTPASQLPTR